MFGLDGDGAGIDAGRCRIKQHGDDAAEEVSVASSAVEPNGVLARSEGGVGVLLELGGEGGVEGTFTGTRDA